MKNVKEAFEHISRQLKSKNDESPWLSNILNFYQQQVITLSGDSSNRKLKLRLREGSGGCPLVDVAFNRWKCLSQEGVTKHPPSPH